MFSNISLNIDNLINFFFCGRIKTFNKDSVDENFLKFDKDLLELSERNPNQLNKNYNLSKSILDLILNDAIIIENYNKLINFKKFDDLHYNIYVQNKILQKIIDRILLLEETISEKIELIIKKSIQKNNDNELCCICLDNVKNCAYINCGHLCVCDNCINNKWKKKCPICKTRGNYIRIWR